MKQLFNLNIFKGIKLKEKLSYAKKIIFNKKTLIVIIVFSIIIFTLTYTPNEEDKTSIVPNFSIDTQEIKEEELYILKTYPANNSEVTAFSISVDFSKEIINKSISVSTVPFMDIETNVLPSNPYKLFITPDKPWEYIDYKIIIRSDELKEDFILNIKFKEQEPPTPINESGIQD